ncbi:S41 family peptidase [Shewanella amazonensis]|uniref:C-terminal processing peptidase-3. Serine peptidase. MEROPS family S41A n=1 Tax=Shewanella amazonensis (strain ATCC BAA-1098 / SB2B) TaxID=326297 RepID=A1S1L4_SHEAM|nr:S41 family peptidase [Shewanella amazonensis]ABL98270.1 C-terminal processing peptidase-3. Serine peptidase. MEROPS family S41A [Shewanella amazonensis SB2B]
MKQFIRYLGATVFGLALGISVSLSGQENARSVLSQYDYPLLVDIMDTIETYYVNQISRDELIEGAIEGMFKKLDPYSGYLSHQDLINIRDTNRGEYFGYGFEIASDDNLIRIVSPFSDSPADKAGIIAGDTIIAVNSHQVADMDLNAVLAEIRYHSLNNLPLTLTLEHSDKISYQVTLRPATISVASVQGRWLEGEIAYVRLTSFQDNTTEDLVKQLSQWNSPKGLILDLRNNPGGLLDQAIRIADLFLAKGRIVSTSGRYFDANSDYFASPQTLMTNVPMMVLINKGSASASEVLAAALQENGRALLIGETSFGKGTVQSLIPTLNMDSAIKLTIAHYNTPKGHDIHAKGIEPDIKIAAQNTVKDAGDMPIIGSEQRKTQLEDQTLASAIAWIENQK